MREREITDLSCSQSLAFFLTETTVVLRGNNWAKKCRISWPPPKDRNDQREQNVSNARTVARKS